MVDPQAIDRLAALIETVRFNGGRLFVLGIGGSAANASHAVNDFRKLANVEAYCPTDNAAELTARTNDQGWSSVFVEWLKASKLGHKDGLCILSVGGGTETVSQNLVQAVQYAYSRGAVNAAILGRPGLIGPLVDALVLIPEVNPERVTPHAEAFQSVVLHLLVTHPLLKRAETTW